MGANSNTPPTCYCFTCGKWFHSLGITSHRASHKRKREDCEIEYTYGNRIIHRYSMHDERLRQARASHDVSNN